MANTKITSDNLDTLTTLTVDDITIDGSTISDAGDFTLDVGGDIILDAGGADISFKVAGTEFGSIFNVSDNLYLNAAISDKDIILRGNDGGSFINALTLDMSDAGKATFNAGANFGGAVSIATNAILSNGTLTVSSGSGAGYSTQISTEYAFPKINTRIDAIAGASYEGQIFFRTSSGGGSATERMRIDSAGLVSMTHAAGGHTGGLSIINSQAGGYGSALTFQSERSDDNSIVSAAQIRTQGQDSWNSAASADSNLIFATALNGSLTDKMFIKHDGAVGIGVSPSYKLDVQGAAGDVAIFRGDANNTIRAYLGSSYQIFQAYNGTNTNQFGYVGDVFYIQTAATERMRIDSLGRLLIGKNNAGFEVAGINTTTGDQINITSDGVTPLQLNRLSSDGGLITFAQATSTEGSVTVSGSTVSYNGFSGNHETSGISTDTEIGTVCSTIDELDTYVSGTKSGQTRADHAKIKISDTVGDTRVYGILASYSETDNKPVVASVGIGSIKVTGACSGGDLLESNGDGTAKVQSDDIIKSKTIGKVTIGNSSASVKLVSCVLYCG